MIEIAENRVTTGFREARKKLNKNREKIEKLKTEIKEIEELSLGEKKEEYFWYIYPKLICISGSLEPKYTAFI